MRPRGCRRCKEKHLKCNLRRVDDADNDGKSGRHPCANCAVVGAPCRQPPRNIRLRAVRSVLEQSRSADEEAREIPFSYGPDHTWVTFPKPVRFATGDRSDEDESEIQTLTETNDTGLKRWDINGTERTRDLVPDTASVDWSTSFTQQHYLSPVATTITPRLPVTTPTGSAVIHQPLALWPFSNRKEPELLRYWIDTIGPQVDATDQLMHFTSAVPRRAAHSPLLLYAVIATASIHRSRILGVADEFSEEYQARCLRILIRFLDDPDYRPDETFLAAIVVLRKFEEMSTEDHMCHLLGSARIINSIGAVAAHGGLGEAAAWLALRQSLYVCLTSNTPLNLNLDCYRASSSFTSSSDHAWANRSVLIFAEVLNVSSSPFDNLSDKVEALKAVGQAASSWYQDKPDTFRPLYERQPSSGAGEETQRFPEILMLEAPHVIGLMYYHLTLTVLALQDSTLGLTNDTTLLYVSSDNSPMANPNPSATGSGPFNPLQRWRSAEACIRQHVRICVGLATSNHHCIAAHFEASHILLACGHCLSSEGERRGAIAFLRDIPSKLGWETETIVESLEKHWNG